MPNRQMPGTDLGLVSWPVAGQDAPSGGTWRDSGEGGLWAIAAWPHRGAQWDRCMVGPLPWMGMWDVMVGAHGPEAADFLEVEAEWHEAVAESDRDGAARVGYSFGAYLFLGSTGQSLGDDNGDYLTVTPEHLSEQGRALLASMEAVYGPATIVTFLDT